MESPIFPSRRKHPKPVHAGCGRVASLKHGTRLLIRDVQIVDVTSGAIRFGSIHIDDGIISAITDRAPFEPDVTVPRMSANGAFVVPGLVDAHVHVTSDARPFGTSNEVPLNRAALQSEEQLTAGLLAGVTTMRDAGSYDQSALSLRRRDFPSPRLLACGPLITYPGGHGKELGIEVSSRSEMESAVEANLQSGADFIKVASDPDDSEAMGEPRRAFNTEDLAFIVERAHNAGLRVACHTFPSAEGVRRAVAAGVDTIEHAAPIGAEQVELIASSSSILVPTVVAAADEFAAEDVEKIFSIPAREWRELSRSNFGETALPPSGTEPSPSIRTWATRLVSGLPLAFDAGLYVATGTDAGCRGTGFASVPREIQLLRHLGASPLQALQSATTNGARALGLDAVGQIKVGFAADLLLLRGNPLLDLQQLFEPLAVVCGGRLVSTQLEEFNKLSYYQLRGIRS